MTMKASLLGYWNGSRVLFSDAAFRAFPSVSDSVKEGELIHAKYRSVFSGSPPQLCVLQDLLQP